MMNANYLKTNKRLKMKSITNVMWLVQANANEIKLNKTDPEHSSYFDWLCSIVAWKKTQT